MGRFVVVEILVFFAPIFLFLLYVRIFHKKKAIEALNLRVLTILIAIGVAGSAIGAMYLSSLDSKDLTGTYVPAAVVDGVEIPAHFE
ncbi:MAG: hypothetical protein HRU29_06820 [Rhizobiales bacterium]|nr:hypothetical protein [Hyphomicrobiales bacterium]NRB14098.1 hypothetical protein [Hyphomicrobiales bacterium]